MTAQYANVGAVPLALAIWLAHDRYDYDHTPKTISTTTLLKPVRQIILAGRVPEGEALPSLASMVKSRIGTAIHDALETSWLTNAKQSMKALGFPASAIDRVVINPDPGADLTDLIPVYVEQRHSKTVGDWTVTGKYDIVIDGQVADFKSTGVFSYKNQTNTTKWSWQGSIYRWLRPDQITDSEMQIHFIFTDWKPGLVKSDPNYPRDSYYTQSITLHSIAATDSFVRDKLAQLERYTDADEADIPLCEDEDLWRSEPVFKYYKNGDTTAKRSTKNFPTYQQALVFKGENGNVGAIKEVPGQVTACKYCPAFAACSQKDQLIASGDLVME